MAKRKTPAKKGPQRRKTTSKGGRTLHEGVRKSAAPARRKKAAGSKKKKAARKKTNRTEQLKLVRQGMQQALYIVTIFGTLVLLSLSFLLYQWKDYKMVEYGKEIQQLKSDILRLNSETSRNRARINTDLERHPRIEKLAYKLGLRPALPGEEIVLTVDEDKWKYYVRKDEEKTR